MEPFSDLNAILREGQRLQYYWENYGTQDVTISIRQLGELVVPSGKLIACDPLIGPDSRYRLVKAVKPGRYPVIASAAHFLPVDSLRFACALLRISEEATVRWEAAGISEPDPRSDKLRYSYSVDAGTGCFMDCEVAEAVEELISEDLQTRRARSQHKPDEAWKLDDEDNSRFEQEFCAPLIAEMERNSLGQQGPAQWANLRISKTTEANVIAFSSGWGDGGYSSFWGYDSRDQVTSLVTDFALF